MIKKELVENRPTSAWEAIQDVLYASRDWYLTKEEIYAQMPTDEGGVSLISISSVEGALRALSQMGKIDCLYIRGKQHFAYREPRERR